MTRQLILGTAGHIDHGKTALIKALTGTDTDRLPQEKERGITIDIGFAALDVGDYRLGIVDVPGHERFIKNMLAGAAGVDVAMLVIAADDSVMPQTREHLAILQLLQIRHGLIALTKTDLADPDWVDLVEEDVRELVAGTFLEEAPIVRTSAIAGQGTDDLKTALLEVCAKVEEEGGSDLFRMAVDRSFVVSGLGTIVTGTVWSGAAEAGQEVEWLPEARNIRIRGLQTHGSDTDTIGRGQRAAVNLQNVHHTEIRRGHELATPGRLTASRRITVRLDALADSPWPIAHRSRVRLHIGTQEVMAGLRLLHSPAVQPGESEYAQFISAEPIIAAQQQPFVVRAESPLVTIGGGVVLQPTSHRLSRRDPETVARLEALNGTHERERAAAAIFFFGAEPWTDLDLCRDANIAPNRAGPVVTKLANKGIVVELEGGRRKLRLHSDHLEILRNRVLRAMKRLHAASPLDTSISRSRLASAMSYLDKDAVTAIAENLIADDLLAGDDTTVWLPEFKPTLTGAQKQLRSKVIEAHADAGITPPEVAKLAKQLGVKEQDVKAVVELCASEGELVHVSSGMYMHRDAAEVLRRRVTDVLKGGEGMTVSQIKDALEITRRHAVPICEYLDRAGITKRQGDVRTLA